MARGQLASLALGVFQDKRGNVKPGETPTILDVNGDPITIYAGDEPDMTTITSLTDSDGQLEGWADEGRVSITLNGKTIVTDIVPATSPRLLPVGAELAPPAFVKQGTLPVRAWVRTPPSPVVIADADPAIKTDGMEWIADPANAGWNGFMWDFFEGSTTDTSEGGAGQRVQLKTRPIGADPTNPASWSAAIQPFSDPTYCNNPITATTSAFSPLATRMPPTMTGTGRSELWCEGTLSDYADSDGPAANDRHFLAKLTDDPGAKWTVYRFEWNGLQPQLANPGDVNSSTPTTPGGAMHASIDGVTTYTAFPACGAGFLLDGRYAIVDVFQSDVADPGSLAGDGGASPWLNAKKLLVVRYWDGTSWTMSEPLPTSTLVPPSALWEAFIVQPKSGELFVYCRLNYTSATASNAQQVWRSTNGKSFSGPTATDNMVPVARSGVVNVGSRLLMPHCDFAASLGSFGGGRQNGTLFVGRRGNDFAPAIPFSTTDKRCVYPFLDESAIVTGIDGEYAEVRYYTGGQGTSSAPALTGSRVKIPTDETVAYLFTRQVFAPRPHGPDLVAAIGGVQPAGWHLDGQRKVTPAATPTSASPWISAWLRPDDTSVWALADARTNVTSEAFVLSRQGLALHALNFFHGVTLTTGQNALVSAAVDGSAGTVTHRIAEGGATSLTIIVQHFVDLNWPNLPVNNETVVIDGTTYTFKTSPAGGHDVQIGVSVATTAANLITALGAGYLTDYWTNAKHLLIAKTDYSALGTTSASSGSAITVGTPVQPEIGTAITLGYKGRSSSSLTGFIGEIYKLQGGHGTFTDANAIDRYDDLAASFGYSTIAGGSTAPAGDFTFDSTATLTTFPDLLDPVEVDSLVGQQMTYRGQVNGPIELPWDHTALTVPVKLQRQPVSGERWVIATIGTQSAFVHVFVVGDNTGSTIYIGQITASSTLWTKVGPARLDPSSQSFTVEISVEDTGVRVNGVWRQFGNFFGQARLYLGCAFASTFPSPNQGVTFDLSQARVSEQKTPDRPPILDAVLSYSSVTQTVPNNATTPLAFDTDILDTNSVHDQTGAPTKFFAKHTGLHYGFCNHEFPFNSGLNRRELTARVNGTGTVLFDSKPPISVSGAGTRMNVGGLIWLNAGDYVEYCPFQTSGATLTIPAATATSTFQCCAGLIWLGSYFGVTG